MITNILKRAFAFCTLALLFLACNTSVAGVLLSYTSSPNPILQGGTGSIDVTLKNQDLANLSQDILSFDFTLSATPASGITFTSLGFPVLNYIYGVPGESFAINNSLALQNGPGGSTISANDLWDLLPVPGRILSPGETVLLATIQFSVAANATPGNHFLTFTTADLARFDLDTFDLAPVDGVVVATPSITIQQQTVTAVPEPVSVLVFLTLTGLVVMKRGRVQKQS